MDMNIAAGSTPMARLWGQLAGGVLGWSVAKAREIADGRLLVFSDHLRYTSLLGRCPDPPAKAQYYLAFRSAELSGPGRWVALARFAGRLVRILSACRTADLYLMSRRQDRLPLLTAAIACRMKGVSIVFHDWSFGDEPGSLRLLHSVCQPAAMDGAPSDLAIADGPEQRSRYDRLKKDRAVPKVIVCGDYEDRHVVSLARRVYDLVKQKYPRTEFALVSPLDWRRQAGESANESFSWIAPKDEDDLLAVYTPADILMLLSPGRISRLYADRGYAAGYPIIVNGFDYGRPDDDRPAPIVVPRDSYSALAEAVIKLVDDEEYYRSFRHS
jgi:hypothetical protein